MDTPVREEPPTGERRFRGYPGRWTGMLARDPGEFTRAELIKGLEGQLKDSERFLPARVDDGKITARKALLTLTATRIGLELLERLPAPELESILARPPLGEEPEAAAPAPEPALPEPTLTPLPGATDGEYWCYDHGRDCPGPDFCAESEWVSDGGSPRDSPPASWEEEPEAGPDPGLNACPACRGDRQWVEVGGGERILHCFECGYQDKGTPSPSVQVLEPEEARVLDETTDPARPLPADWPTTLAVREKGA